MSDNYRSGAKPLGRKEYELYYMCCITQLTVRKVTNMLILTMTTNWFVCFQRHL